MLYRGQSRNSMYASFLKNKQQETYERLFDLSKDLTDKHEPHIIKIDFEIAVMSALRSRFPTSRKSGFFYLSQSLMEILRGMGFLI